MILLNYSLLFVLGLATGSFLNVLIDRIPRGRSIWKGRSTCDHCGRTLSWSELVPVLSWITLKRRCRNCHSKLSLWYPVIELATGLIFVLTYLAVKMNTLSLVSGSTVYPDRSLPQEVVVFFWLAIMSGLIAIFTTDLKYGIIPDIVVYPSLLMSILILLLSYPLSGHFPIESLLAATFGAGFFYFLHWVTRGKGMGLGDVKYVALMGLILGHPRLWIGLYVSFLTGAATGVILILGQRIKLKQTVPFGPFLIIGTVVGLIWGDTIYRWWSRFIF